MAFWTSTAVVVESTPPLTADNTRLSFACALIFSIAVSIIDLGVQLDEQPQIRVAKFLTISIPFSVCATSG